MLDCLDIKNWRVAYWCDANFENYSGGDSRNSRSLILMLLPGKSNESIMKIRISGHLNKNDLSRITKVFMRRNTAL